MHLEHAPAEASRHKCLIYDGHPSEQLSVVVPLFLDGLRENWRCLYLGSPETIQMVDSALEVRGVDTGNESQRGALVFSSDRSHLEGGNFDPRALIDGLVALVDGAVHDGFQGLCATGDMRWELGTDQNFERLQEYEARLEQVIRAKPLRGICQYHRDTVPARAVRDALLTHRSTYIGRALNQDNLFYLPPEILLDEGDRAKQGEWMYQQIARVLKAERTRDEALAALAAANRDLERRVAERTAELTAANKDMEAFSYSVSHDLKAPVRAIKGFSEFLAEDFSKVLGKGGTELIERILASVGRMEHLIEGMLVLARVVKTDLRREPVDLSAMADEVAREIRHLAPERSADFAVHLGMTVVGDRVLLRNALTNLLGNAWKFTARQATARIEVGRRGDEGDLAVFYVRDNGVGFDPHAAKHLFGAFQRLHSQEEFPGTGVGLASVQRIIERHGGRIWAEGAPNQGATFSFTLPRVVPG